MSEWNEQISTFRHLYKFSFENVTKCENIKVKCNTVITENYSADPSPQLIRLTGRWKCYRMVCAISFHYSMCPQFPSCVRLGKFNRLFYAPISAAEC